MSGLQFGSSTALYFLLLVPIFYFLAKVSRARSEKLLRRTFNHKILKFLTQSKSENRARLKLHLFLIALASMIFAYARPQNPEGKQKVKNEGIELLLLADVSNSMLAEDVKPSRLALLKAELQRLVDLSSGDRIGIVAFAGSAALLSPMTTDQDAVKMFIEALSPDMVSSQGTNFGMALKVAADAFERGGLGNQEGVQVTRAILVASDGEDQEDGALDIAKELKAKGIFIFTLAFGSEAGGAIPIRDENGILRGYKRDQDNQPVISKTSGAVLKDIAVAGGGAFHHASFQSDSIQKIRTDIENLKKTQFETGEIQTYEEYFQLFLFFALLFAAVELLLSERRGQGRIWQGRFEVSRE